MQFQHDFTLPIPPDQAWATLLDVERIAACMPGASLDHINGDDFSGRVTLKVGPLKLAYRGDARITEKDAAARRLVIAATGREARGSGTAEATVTASLEPAGEGTRVALLTDLALTGRPAQFGRGLVNEVGGTIIGQFAERLSHELQNGGRSAQTLTEAPDAARAEPLASSANGGGIPSAQSGSSTAPTTARSTAPAQDAESSLDVLSLLRPALGSRGLLAAAGAAGLLVAFLLGRRSRSAGAAAALQRVPWPVAVVIEAERR